MKESELYGPLKAYLEGQGYEIHPEVRHCDIVARKGEELLAVEMKTAFSLQLVYQGVARQEVYDSVYLAVPCPPGKRTIPNQGEAMKLLRRLEMGLILVRFLTRSAKVEIALHPKDYVGRHRAGERLAIIREIDGRFAEFHAGGLTSREEKLSAYKQRALLIASLLGRAEETGPKDLAERGGGPKTGGILRNNFYGWFERVDLGRYRLSKAGWECLERYSDQIGKIAEEAGKRGQPEGREGKGAKAKRRPRRKKA
jgi:hypothetical protein